MFYYSRWFLKVIGPSGVQFRDREGARGRFEITNYEITNCEHDYEHDYPWIVRHEVQLLINRINIKIRG